MTDIWIVREADANGDGEGWLSFHRSEATARATMRRIAEERTMEWADEGAQYEDNWNDEEGTIALFLDEREHPQVWWWVEKETLED